MLNIKLTSKLTGLIIAGALLSSLTFTSCKKSSGGTDSGNSQTSMGVTDGAIDDPNVSGVFVTITDIRLDGQSVQGFTKTTVNIASLQNGNVQTIGNFNLKGKTYSTVTFVLDYGHDASGNAPGVYVVTTDNVKHALTSSSNSITISKNFTLYDSAHNAIVADFDLRKMIVHPTTGDTASFNLVTTAELQNSIRVINQNTSAAISGTFTKTVDSSDAVIAYLYKRGTFTIAEAEGQGASHVQFANAVTSSVVGQDGSYKFAFVDSGSYEIHFANYREFNHNGRLKLVALYTAAINNVEQDILNFLVELKAILTSINITASAEVSVND
jgi:hypothetical protein